MGQKITTKMPRAEGIVAGATIGFKIPVGKRIHKLILKYAYDAVTQNIADFLMFRLMANNQVIQQFTGVERDTINQFDGKSASTGILEIPLDRSKLMTVDGREETAWNTGSVDPNTGKVIDSVYLEIDLDPGMTISPNDLELWAQESDALPGGPGTMMYIKRDQRTLSAANSDYQVGDLVDPAISAPDKIGLNRLHIVPSAGQINHMKIRRNNYVVWERDDDLNREMQTNGIRVPQAGYYTIDPSEEGQGSEVISLFGMTDYRYHIDQSAAATLTFLSEYMGVLNV